MKSFLALLRAAFLDMFRDRMVLFWFILFPVLLIVIFGSVFSPVEIFYIFPGILAMGVMQLGLFGAMRLLVLRERKILKNFGVVPVPRPFILAGEITVRLLVAAFQSLIILLLSDVLYQLGIVRFWIRILPLILLGAGVFVTLGYLLVSLAKSEESGQGVIQLVQVPMLFLSGIFFPIEALPTFLQPLARILPLTFLGEMLRQIVGGIPAPRPLWLGTTVLVCWLAANVALTVRFWRWE